MLWKLDLDRQPSGKSPAVFPGSASIAGFRKTTAVVRLDGNSLCALAWTERPKLLIAQCRTFWTGVNHLGSDFDGVLSAD